MCTRKSLVKTLLNYLAESKARGGVKLNNNNNYNNHKEPFGSWKSRLTKKSRNVHY